MVNAAVTRWFSHGAACKRCRERYVVVAESLDDVITQNPNPGWNGYRNALLQQVTVLEIAFLEDVLLTTNTLGLLLQSDKKDFGAVNRAICTLESMRDSKQSSFFKFSKYIWHH